MVQYHQLCLHLSECCQQMMSLETVADNPVVNSVTTNPMLAYRIVSIQSLQIFFPFETQIKANLCVSAPTLVTGTFYYAHIGQGSSSPIKIF